MRKLINKSFHWYYGQRIQRIQAFRDRPHKVQEALLFQLFQATKHTEWGKKFDYESIRSPEDFANRVPIQDYESLKPYINRMMHGEKDVLWSGRVKWFSKSAGTTSDKSKFIPVSNQNLKQCHIRGTWDTMNLFYHQKPKARQFECKSLLMGGSIQPFASYPKTLVGDVSAIMIQHMPYVARPFFTPDFETALMDNFEAKIERMVEIVSQEKDMVMIGGVPSWTVVLFRKILEYTGKDNLLELWPNLELYVHGGVSFTPYKKQFQEFIPSDKMEYMEIYNASEGYFAIQDKLGSDDMLLLLNNGVYYEFLPPDEWYKPNPKAIPLKDVQIGENYAIIISTNAGLWRYTLGDTVQFTSTNPYKIKITGRTKQYVNVFGEEVMVANTDKAIAETCKTLNASVAEYTVAPIYFDGRKKGGHEWIIEFEKTPNNIDAFNDLLDSNLQKINSDYEAKRFKGIALKRLKLRVVPRGSFHRWLKSKGKYGGQNKIPRLSNHRTYIEDIINFLQEEV